MKNLSWYFGRLSKMPPAEVLHRIKHLYFSVLDKNSYARKPPEVKKYISHKDILKLTCLSPSSLEVSPLNKTHLINDADSYCHYNMDVFGISYTPGGQIDWHKDPKTGNSWPIKYCGEVPIRDGVTVGGVKFVWEVNRLYGLPLLGLAYNQTNQSKYADKIFSTLASWIKANQYPQGVNWTSGIELSVRVANLCWGLSFLNGYTFSSSQIKLVNDFLWLHGRHLYRYPSKHSSNNNHAIAEAFGLFLLGAFFTSFPDAPKWLSFGKRVLERECARQVLPDGGSYEFTTSYLSLVLDFFILFKLVCEHLEIPYEPIIDQRLEKGCEFISRLMDCRGNFPNIGDQDSAVLVNLGLDNQENLQSILNTGAVLFNRKGFKDDFFPDLKTSVLLGEERISDFRRLTADRPGRDSSAFRSEIFEESGLSVIQGKSRGHRILFVGNATQLGMPPLYAHGHLDALSFYLTVNGREIFVDPGTYLYHSGGRWRNYFRSTAAHNTLRINGSDFTDMPGDFMYGKPYNIVHHSLQSQDKRVCWCAEHDAYLRLENPVRHKREVVLENNSLDLLVIDEIKPEGECIVELFFHFHPDCVVTCEKDQAIIANDGINIALTFSDSLEIKKYRGSEEPLLGWFSKSFNHLEQTTTIVCKQKINGDTILKNKISII